MNASDIINRLTYHRRRQGPVIRYARDRNPDLADKLLGCGSWVHLRDFLKHEVARIRNANFCKKALVCLSCASRRCLKLIEAYEPKVRQVLAENPGLIPVMITLTLKNGPDLVERLAHGKLAFKAMNAATRKARNNPVKNSLLEWNKVLGGIRSTEVTRNDQTGEWHVHYHVFGLVSNYIDRIFLSAEWTRFTGDSKIVDVRKCKPKPGKEFREGDDGIVDGLFEVIKYVSKPSKLQPCHLLDLFDAAQGSRFTTTFGLLYGVKEPELDQDDCTGLDGPYQDYTFHWLGDSYLMQKVSHSLAVLKPGDDGYEEAREVPCPAA